LTSVDQDGYGPHERATHQENDWIDEGVPHRANGENQKR
jgi:hypothetical protein